MADTEPSREELLRLGEEAFRCFKAKAPPEHSAMDPAEMKLRHDHLEALVSSQNHELNQIRAALGIPASNDTAGGDYASQKPEAAITEIQALRSTVAVVE